MAIAHFFRDWKIIVRDATSESLSEAEEKFWKSLVD